MAKIETSVALDHLPGIVGAADAVMVARGDLGVELGPQDVPLVQKRIIKRANELGLPVITATQMLESMVEHPRPTRAEANDVANAVLDGTDAVMLSAETASGAFPSLAVQAMHRIAMAAETYPVSRGLGLDRLEPGSASVEETSASLEEMSSMIQATADHAQNAKTLDEYYEMLDRGVLPVIRGFELNHDDLIRRDVIMDLMCQGDVSMEAIEQAHGIQFREYFAQELTQLQEFQARIAAQRDRVFDLTLRAPMDGKIVSIKVGAGEKVSKGQTLIVLEAMKMEQPLTAHKSGKVAKIVAEIGETVASGTALCEIID